MAEQTERGETLYAIFNTNPRSSTDCPLPILQRKTDEGQYSGELAIFRDEDRALEELDKHGDKDHIDIATISVDSPHHD